MWRIDEGKSVHLMRGGLASGLIIVVSTNCEKSAEPIVAKKLLAMGVERRAEDNQSVEVRSTS